MKLNLKVERVLGNGTVIARNHESASTTEVETIEIPLTDLEKKSNAERKANKKKGEQEITPRTFEKQRRKQVEPIVNLTIRPIDDEPLGLAPGDVVTISIQQD